MKTYNFVFFILRKLICVPHFALYIILNIITKIKDGVRVGIEL